MATTPTLDDYEATDSGYRHKTHPFEVVRHEFLGTPSGGFEVRRTGHDFKYGYIVLAEVEGLSAALDVVASHIVTDTERAAAGETYAEATERHDEQAQAPAADVPPLPKGVELVEFGAAEPSSYVYMVDGVDIATMPSLKIAKRPRERKGRNGYVLAGWAVSVGGTEIDRKGTKREARARLDLWLARHLAKPVTV